ncbi:LysR family transcriptional regulator ArgP [Frankia sp. AgB1.9]|uniref:LysR family transcriptional regulator ArgP n=1 Tax=unclassified Frankia TaxID=2632575 RepID=UPI0019323BA7|nr:MULTISPECIES: LysR family transcriptional regulator ArgP [unclassified Frankia]MBL7490001.1 LysR family transcriptional regulator ArgP [Frankia sp. AgW1.1]MBL7550590.1 LysR family transcriptional regulator ArgP [Frankia sp. AgB1.9]MBL7619817.1 LysR family transcriptional regulator ArgP [Frankia sp. AgB1.8]
MDPELPPAQLATLVAIVELGSFDAAARDLHLTPSAVSQRIRALESAAGQVLVRRSLPCRPTAAGEALLRLARQTRLLHAEAVEALGGRPSGRVELSVAVNADSLETWFRDVVAEVARWDDVVLRLHVEDQAFSAGLLRGGEALAAVTSDPVPVQGCRCEPLGTLRYRPAATPEFAARWRADGPPDGETASAAAPATADYRWDRMPLVVFNEKDGLQHELLRARGVLAAPPAAHRVPTTAGFHEAVRVGLGWGMLPDAQLNGDLAAGRLVTLTDTHVDVPLFWQRWRLDSPLLDRLTATVTAAAARHLRRAGPGG